MLTLLDSFAKIPDLAGIHLLLLQEWFPKQVRFGEKKGGPRWLDGWAAATGLGSRCAPVSCFLSGLLGRMGGPRRRGWVFVGLPSCFLSGLLGRMGGPRSWAPIGLPSCFLSGRLGRMGGPRPMSWAPINLPSCFLSCFFSWVGWVGPGSDGWAAAKKLGFYWAPFIFPFWAPSRWAPFMFPSFWAPGSRGGWVGRGKEAGLPLAPFILPFWAAGSDR